MSVDIRDGMELVASLADNNSVLPEEVAAVHVRQLAVHANLAVLAHRNQNSTWLERLKQIETIRKRHGGGGGGVGGGGGGGGVGGGGGGGTGASSSAAVSTQSSGTLPSLMAPPPTAAFDFTRFLV